MLTKLLALVLVFLLSPPASALAGTTRDAWMWPFSSAYIWNMPVGSGAVFRPAGISKPLKIATDAAIIFKQSPEYEAVPVFENSNLKCASNRPTNQQVYLPGSFVFPPLELGLNPEPTPSEHNPSAFLSEDRKLYQYSRGARCQEGGAFYGVPYSSSAQSLFSDGSSCEKGGLAPLGGVIREGELTGSKPIRHALKISLPASLYYAHPGYKWPVQKPGNTSIYRGSNPALTYGSLLALDPAITPASLGVTSAVGYKIFKALQDYGAYVDEAVGDGAVYFVIDQSEEEALAANGIILESESGNVYEELAVIVQSLSVVDNNLPNSVGGGGAYRVPLAPAIN